MAQCILLRFQSSGVDLQSLRHTTNKTLHAEIPRKSFVRRLREESNHQTHELHIFSKLSEIKEMFSEKNL